jgi:cytochrome c
LRLVCRRRSETAELRMMDCWLPRRGTAVLCPYVIGFAICVVVVARAQEGASTSRSVWDGVYTEEQAKRGAEMYRKECASCHGDTLVGGGGAAPLAGGTFLSNWNGLTVGDLFDRIRKTMPQGSLGKLTKQQDADVLAFLLSFNKFPAGKTELQKQVEFLREIRFEATKPATR